MSSGANKETRNLLIIGTGLIGGSIAKAIQGSYNIYAIDTNHVDSEIFTDFSTSNNPDKFAEFINLADTIVVTTPLYAYPEVLSYIKQLSTDEKLIFECGSVKSWVCDIASNLAIKLNLTHPICGSHNSGFAASTPDLFRNKLVILNSYNPRNAELIGIYSQLGANKIITMDVNKHDEIYAKVSHIPQLLSFVFEDIVNTFNLAEEDSHLQEKVPEYRAFRRLAMSNHKIWLQDMGIIQLNKHHILPIVQNLYGRIYKTDQSFGLASLAMYLSRFVLDNCILGLEEYVGQGGVDFTRIANAADTVSNSQIDIKPIDILNILSKYVN